MTVEQLLKQFAPAILLSGKINSQWRRKYSVAGQALLDYFNVKFINEAVYLARNGGIRGECLTCKSPTIFSAKNNKYATFCSPSCGQKNINVINRRRITNLKLYGVANAGGFGTEQHKLGMLKQYGVEHPMLSNVIKEKQVASNLEKYGTKNVFTNEKVKQKIKNTVISRYGVQHVMQRDDIKSKFRTLNGEWLPAITNVAQRKANTLNTITENIRSRLAKHDFEIISSPTGFSYKDVHEIKHLTCGSVFLSPVYSGSIPRCFTCSPKLVGTSKIQLQVEDFLKEQGVIIETNVTGIIGKKHLDIFIRDKNLAIEINGLYHHSELNGRFSDFHIGKTEAANLAGIRLIHLFEDDIDRWDIVKSMLLSLIGKLNTIFARKCTVGEVDKKVAEEFCRVNHLKGTAKFSLAIGLFLGNQLVSVATFGKPRYSKKYDYEIIRFCSLLNNNIVGGFSKILKEFEKLKNPKNLLSYADRCYSEGNVYKQCGFILERISPPNYWYFQNNINKRVHQTQLRKYKLSRMYSGLDLSKTEKELLEERGWNRIWDCGQLIFVKSYNIGEISNETQ